MKYTISNKEKGLGINHQEKILIALIETWNDNNQIDRLNPDLIRLMGTHIGYAYVAGGEQVNKAITKRLELIADENRMIKLDVALEIIKKL